MEIVCKLQTKNYATLKDIVITSHTLPRVGEIIIIKDDEDKDEEYFVYEVKYKLDKNNSLTPHLYCRQWYKGDRYLELAQQGWHLLQYGE